MMILAVRANGIRPGKAFAHPEFFNKWKQMRFIFLKTLIVFAAGFCLFIFLYHQHQAETTQSAVREHARIVAGSVWDLNPEASGEYLRAVATNNHYEYIVVEDVDGKEFIKVQPPEMNVFEKKLVSLKLIPRKTVSADIFYSGERIGKVKAVWLDKSIYVYAYAFLVAMLLFVVVQLYSRILNAKKNLEKKVEERTRNLIQKTEELQSAQEELRYSEELHRVTIGSISDPVFITDDHRNFTYIGTNVSQRLGYSVEEVRAMGNIKALVGRRLFDLEALKRSGEIRNIESRITGKDGTKHIFLTNIKYIH